MTYREYKPTWLQQKIMVDEWGRPPSLADVPLTMMTREKALKDGTKFLARDEHDANLYRVKVGELASPYHGE